MVHIYTKKEIPYSSNVSFRVISTKFPKNETKKDIWDYCRSFSMTLTKFYINRFRQKRKVDSEKWEINI